MFSVLFALRRPVSLSTSTFRFATLGLVAFAACARDARLPSEPAVARAPQLSAMAVGGASSGAVVATGRHIVAFSGTVPANFEAQVNALGGKVLWVSPWTFHRWRQRMLHSWAAASPATRHLLQLRSIAASGI